MSWLDAFLTAYDTITQAGALRPQRQVLNFVSGAKVVDNPTTLATDITITSGQLAQQTVAGGGTVTANVGSRVWCITPNASPWTVNAPAGAIVPGTQWGLGDGTEGGAFSSSQYASVPNAGLNIEDPGAPGVYTNNPIKVEAPSSMPVWEGDPTGTFWKVV